MSTVFLETSALLRALFQEDGAEDVRRVLGSSERILASRLIQVEADRALIRLSLDRPQDQNLIPVLQRDLRDLWPHIHFYEISRDLCELAGRIAPNSRLRTLDALHLATYQHARETDPSTILLSFDQRILDEL